MVMALPPPPEVHGPIVAVLFDYSSTLVDIGEPRAWLEAAWAHAGRAGAALAALGPARRDLLVLGLSQLWGGLGEVDPDNLRDLDPARHRIVFHTLLHRLPEVDGTLEAALYAVLPEVCTPYEDARPTLESLKRRGLRLALVSNIARDLRPELRRSRLLDLFDAVILSFEVGVVKPHAPIFQLALDALGAPAARALMVGDDPYMDAGAALLGIRTLILPTTSGPNHGLGLVLGLVGPGPAQAWT